VRKTLKELVDPSVVDHLVIAASFNTFDDKLGDPWATSSEFSSQVHRELASMFLITLANCTCL
ncbi:MAG: hypothetical protein ACJ8LL_06735, partial [Candidatus Udaeobacter sp.]